jgi:hypothetical protein
MGTFFSMICSFCLHSEQHARLLLCDIRYRITRGDRRKEGLLPSYAYDIEEGNAIL